MKHFHDFDPRHPFKFEESLQIQNCKIRLSHVPMKNSVSIRGFLEESILGDVKPNSFWCDYRESDGYRSANGEIIFDSASEGRFVDVSYLGVGTVLRAEDMRDVSTSLDHFDSLTNAMNDSLQNQSIYIGVIRDNVETAFDIHNEDPLAHKNIRESIGSVQDGINTRYETFNVAVSGLRNAFDSVSADLRREIRLSQVNADSILATAKDYTDQTRDRLEVGFNVYRDQINGIYNAIDNGDSYVENKVTALGSRIDSQLTTERVSALTQMKNLREEVLNRIESEVATQTSLIADRIRVETWRLIESDDQELTEITEKLNQIDSRLDDSVSRYYILQNLLDTEIQDRQHDFSALLDQIESLYSAQDAFESQLSGDFAGLAQTVYQARNAVNIQLDSMKADINLANQNLTYSRNIFERETAKIGAIQTGILNDADSLHAEMISTYDSLIADMQNTTSSLKSDAISVYDSLLAGAVNAESIFNIYNDQFSSIESRIESSIQSAIDQIPEVDLTPVESSIDNISNSFGSSIDHIASSFEQSLTDIDEAFVSSIYALQASLDNLGSRLTSQETKPVILSTVESTIPGALWYSE